MRLRTLLLLLNVLVFVLPIFGLIGFRVYDAQLVRQTQSELLAQGALLAQAYRSAFELLVLDPGYGNESQVSPAAGPLALTATVLDAKSSTPEPRASDAEISATEPDAQALQAAAAVAPLLSAVKRETLAGVRLTDLRGVVVASSGAEHGMSLLKRREVASALAGEPTSLLRERIASDPGPAPLNSLSRNTGWRVFVAVPVLTQAGRVAGAVVLSRTPMTLGKALWQDRWFFTTSVTVMLAVVVLVSLLGTYLLARPVERATRRARAIAAGEAVKPLDARVSRFGLEPEELLELETALAAMAQTLELRARYIKTFAAAVSHEFKTPLTSMRGALELLHDHLGTMSAEQRQTFLTQLLADTDRLERLVRRLLELARADVAKAGADGCRLDEVLIRCAERRSSETLHIRVETPERLLVAMDLETAETLVSNLVDNARQHGTRDGVTSLLLRATARDEDVVLRVRDDGSGISAGNSAKIFEPFFTTARGQGGTGLGLNIVRALAEAHGGGLALAPDSTDTALDGTVLRGAGFDVRFLRRA